MRNQAFVILTILEICLSGLVCLGLFVQYMSHTNPCSILIN